MSTDSTELTFIRCPSCRSLVPALSTRCRMCGYNLEQNASTAKSDEEPKAKENNENGDQVAEEVEAKTEHVENDPLNDFLDDLDSEDDEEEQEDFAVQEEDPIDSEEDDFDEEEAIKELDSLLEELNASEDDEDGDEGEDESGDDPVEEIVEEVKEPKKQAKAPKPKPEKTKAKKSAPKKEVAKAESKPKKKDPKDKLAAKKKTADQTKTVAPVDKVKDIKPVSFQQARSQAALFGWLVSYDSPDGESLEIRQGKFFVTRKSLKKTDLILEDDSVSTPHALITLDSELGFQVQDLMSEQGVYVKSRGSDQYELVEDIEVVESGDWIRFGNVEYLVVFVPE